MNEYLTVKQVAAMFGTCEDTIYIWCSKGRLPFIKTGRLIRFRRTSIEKAMTILERNTLKG